MIKAFNLCKSFEAQKILKGVNLILRMGESCAIVGRSGEGKTTLLHILGTLESPDSGELWIDNQKVTPKNMEECLKKNIGFIFQNYNVLEDFTVLENLKLADRVRGIKTPLEKIDTRLRDFGLASKKNCLARNLSGGEKQRLAIIRALLHEPKIILADEPTGSLDQSQAKMIEDLLINRVKSEASSLILVTHDLELAAKCDRILHLCEGHLVETL